MRVGEGVVVVDESRFSACMVWYNALGFVYFTVSIYYKSQLLVDWLNQWRVFFSATVFYATSIRI